ncbi:hypothetical protein Taro_025410 [Colocasia esculenta]|uniref:Uncharacterized protein n=1 Tax=Colocasia esculenta TaxID=4460 RepID=A0A843VA33_COLES|nr:hypothetical protein [Colocasia esculenta]
MKHIELALRTLRPSHHRSQLLPEGGYLRIWHTSTRGGTREVGALHNCLLCVLYMKVGQSMPSIWLHTVDVVVFLLMRASRGVRSRLSSRPRHLRVLYFPPLPPVDYGVFMQGLVQAMQTQAHTQAALQAQMEAQVGIIKIKSSCLI